MFRAVAIAGAFVLAYPSGARALSDRAEEGVRLSAAKAPIRFYQKYISDLRYGRCQFEPSCSQYALEAIEKYGVCAGAALAADRLVRCHGDARPYYPETARGRLADPPGPLPGPGRTPRFPEWILPAPPGRYRPPQDSAGARSDADREARMLEIAEFADELSANGDCYRAATEYKRFAFLASDAEAAWWTQMKIGECRYARGDWAAAALEFGEAAARGRTAIERVHAVRMAAASYFNDGDYRRALRELDRLGVDGAADSAMTGFQRGVCHLAAGTWQESGALFRGVILGVPGSALGEASSYLARRAEEGPGLPRRNAYAAATLSALIPGTGHLYAGRAYDGLRHFIVDGLLIYTAYRLFSEEQYGGGYLVAGFALPFYAGNVAGAYRSAQWYNESKRLESVSRWIDEAIAPR